MQQDKEIEQLQQALAKVPRDLNNWLSLIEALLRGGQVEVALDAVQRALLAIGDHDGLLQLRLTLEQSIATLAHDSEPWADELETLTNVVDSKELAKATTMAEQFTAKWPESVTGWTLLSECQNRLGDHQSAISSIKRALRLKPRSARLHTNLGVTQQDAGDLAAGEASLDQALELDPNHAEAHLARGSLLREQGHLISAESSYLRALGLRPDLAAAHHNLGNLLMQLERREEAETHFRQALALAPGLAEAAEHLGLVLMAQGRDAEAEHVLREALEVDASSIEVRCKLCIVLRNAGRALEARREYLHILEQQPDHADARLALAALESEWGQRELAEQHYRQALKSWPTRADVLERAALFLAHSGAQGHAGAAEDAYRQALDLEPDNANTWANLGDLLRKQNRREEALAAHQRALDIDPKCALAQQNMGMLLFELGRFDEASAAFREALACKPDYTLAISNMLFVMGFSAYPAAAMRSEAGHWEQVALSPQVRQQAHCQRLTREPLAHRPLRLGVLSSEFGLHAVGFFLWPWLKGLDRRRCELFLYPARLLGKQSKQFETLADAWTPVVGMSDHQAAERIRADNIDVLIETSGHTDGQRLGIVGHRVAPVQCHYIGYFATTGLTEMDYFIGDSVFTPPDQDRYFSETVWRLPRSRYAYPHMQEAPAPAWRPDPQGRLRLGSFNKLVKVREETLALWAMILRAEPTAYLLLKDKTADDPMIRDRILRALKAEGIAADRVQFASRVPSWAAHMGLYNEVDLALDPTPFTSATTGFDALWMGTPLVTLLGEQPASRQAASMLAGLGQSDWIAETPEEYVRIARKLLRDVDGRRYLRATMRERMDKSELCDGTGLAAVLLDAFYEMFNRWQVSIA